MNIRFENYIPRLAVCTALTILAAGCARVDPRQDYDAAAAHVAEATGQGSFFDPDDEAAAAETVEELLEGGLTVEESVQIALLNNPSFQAGFFRLGMSRADLVQSGLFSNPSLALSFAFPEGGGRSNIQANLAQNIVDLWQIPIRKRVARAKLDQEIFSLSQQAARLVVDTKIAYFAAIGAARTLEIAEANRGIADELLETTRARQKAGAVGELDVNLAAGIALNNELDMQTARLDAANAKRRLATLLGLTTAAGELNLIDPLPSAGFVEIEEDAIVELARASRLDLKAARMAVDAGRERVTEEYAKIFPDVTLGAHFERMERRSLPGRDLVADTARASVAAGQLAAPDIQSRGERNAERRKEIETILGPAVSMTLPIFDQNQAQIAKADYAYRAAMKELEALDRSIVQETRRVVDQAATAARLSQFYEAKILPQAQKNLDLGNISYKTGRTSLLTVLDAQRFLLSTRRLAVASQQSAATAIAELEFVVGRPISAVVDRATQNAGPVNADAMDATTQPVWAEEQR